jgi:hydroxymethylbilane synthase
MKIIARNSRLSLIQAHIVKGKIDNLDPSVEIEIFAKPSRGDLDTTTPIYEMGGRDVFTKDIDDFLIARQADFAVHSMKDVSIEHLEEKGFKTAVIEREIPHDIVIFSKKTFEKIQKSNPKSSKPNPQPSILKIGTSSLRRQTLVPAFLQKALPNATHFDFKIEPIRGNVDTRLRKLQAGEFDAIVLAAAGLKRLLGAIDKSHTYFDVSENANLHLKTEPKIADLLENCHFMFLPLTECPPAAAQGALLVSCLADNTEGGKILEKINDFNLEKQLAAERTQTARYGGGCHQRFGVINVPYNGGEILMTQGLDTEGGKISDFKFQIPDLERLSGIKNLFSATSFMSDFFERQISQNIDYQKLRNAKTVFVSHHHAAIFDEKILEILRGGKKQIWASGTRTWFELARRGVWVSGCADGFGLEWFCEMLGKAHTLTEFDSKNCLLLTNSESGAAWENEGFDTLGTYDLKPTFTQGVIEGLKNADTVFWTSYRQYHFYKKFIQKDVLHLCPSGKTADLLRHEGLNPIVFPTIRAFLSRFQDGRLNF